MYNVSKPITDSPPMWTQPSDVISANENSDTPSVTALLSKGQGSADASWNGKTEPGVAPSHSVCLDGGSWSSHDVCSPSRSVADRVSRCLCSVRCGEQGEGFPAEVRRGSHPAYVPVLAGILGLQHQHHEGELGQAGEHSWSFFEILMVELLYTDTCILMCLFSFYPVRGGANLEQFLHQYVRWVPAVPYRPDQRSRNQITDHLPTGQRLWCPIRWSSYTCKTCFHFVWIHLKTDSFHV